MASITILGQTNWRHQRIPFGIKEQDRLGHIYVIGKTGVGKSTLLLNMAIADLREGRGICVVDPHGDLSQALLRYLPPEREKDTFYLDAGSSSPLCFNPLGGVGPGQRELAASTLVTAFKKIWWESWGPRLEYILRYALLTLMEFPGATLLHLQPLLTDSRFRENVLLFINDPRVRSFWLAEFERYPAGLRTEAVSSVLNKTGVFQQEPLRRIAGCPNAAFSFNQLLDRGGILICNLSKGLIGEEASSILGSLLIASIQQAATRRAILPPEARTPFYLYVDEMHSFVTLSFAGILSECRKFGLGVFLAHQYLDQLEEKVRAAIFGNVGTLVCFQVGAADAAYLERELAPVFSEEDLLTLPRFGIYLKLLIDGVASRPFSADTLPLPLPPEEAGTPQMSIRGKSPIDQSLSPPAMHQDKSTQRPTLFD